jgi:hypothetical protein
VGFLGVALVGLKRVGSRGRFEEQKWGEEAIIGFDSL